MPTKVKRGRPVRYDWERWSDGDWWQTTGTRNEIARFRQAAYKAARRIGKNLETQIEGRTLFFRFVT